MGGIERDPGEVICLVPARAEDFPVAALNAYFAEAGGVRVVREERRRERRSELRRRRERATPDDERRVVRNPNGRRVDERRRAVVQVREPLLPPVVSALARGVVFVSPIPGQDRRLATAEGLRLIVRFQLGDEDAFREIYKRHFDGVYSYLLTALRDRHEAEDSAQEVFIRALRGLERYEFRGSPFEAWLFRIVRNHTLNVKRRAAPVSPAEPARIDLWRDDRDRRAAIGSGRAQQHDEDLLLFVERLPPSQRQVLVLRYMIGLDWADIAAVLDRSSGAVRQLEQRALSYLRQRLEAVGHGTASRTETLPMARRVRPSPVSFNRRRALLGRLHAA